MATQQGKYERRFLEGLSREEFITLCDTLGRLEWENGVVEHEALMEWHAGYRRYLPQDEDLTDEVFYNRLRFLQARAQAQEEVRQGFGQHLDTVYGQYKERWAQFTPEQALDEVEEIAGCKRIYLYLKEHIGPETECLIRYEDPIEVVADCGQLHDWALGDNEIEDYINDIRLDYIDQMPDYDLREPFQSLEDFDWEKIDCPDSGCITQQT